jgi:hypothetical protein
MEQPAIWRHRRRLPSADSLAKPQVAAPPAISYTLYFLDLSAHAAVLNLPHAELSPRSIRKGQRSHRKSLAAPLAPRRDHIRSAGRHRSAAALRRLPKERGKIPIDTFEGIAGALT